MDKIVRINTPPVPNLNDPYAQINWIFFLSSANKKQKTVSYITYAKNIYVDFLQETNGGYEELKDNPRFFLRKYWEHDALIRFNAWLVNQPQKSKTRYSIYKNVRKAMDLAYGLRVIENMVYHAPMFKGVSETKHRASYTSRELEVINAAVAKWISLGISVLTGYVPTGNGVQIRQKNVIKTINIDGNEISTLEASKIYDIPRQTIQMRLRLGWTALEAVGLKRRKNQGAISVTVNGTEYASILLAAKAFNLGASLVRYRLKSGWTIEEAFELSPLPTHTLDGLSNPVRVGDVEYLSINCASIALGFNPKTIQNRLRAGWTIEEAFEIVKRILVLGKPITIEGIEYSSLSKAARAYGVQTSLISARIRKGATPEQAVGLVPMVVSVKDERGHLWAFENKYNCDPIAMFDDLKTKGLLNSYELSGGRLQKQFIKWGVWPNIDSRLIMPFVVQLAILTGLNVESLRSLTTDCYSPSHPLTGQPVIYYQKIRSGSGRRSDGRELHIPFLDLDELMVDGSTAKKIQMLIDIILGLTKKIRPFAPAGISNKLFIFEDVEKSKLGSHKVIVSIEPGKKSQTWTRTFCREENLYEILGQKFNFNIARCRPTLATNMILAGADLLQVQSALGHQNVQTTVSYLDGLQLQPVFNKTISEALQNISQRTFEHQSSESLTKQSANPGEQNQNSLGFIETLSGCGCKNAFNPSDNVKKATNFKEGSVCKYWNMCLLCDNSVITQNSLPKLIVYRDRVSIALNSGSPAVQSRSQLYSDTVNLIDGILEPDNIFPSEVIDNARLIANSENSLIIDQLVYQGI